MYRSTTTSLPITAPVDLLGAPWVGDPGPDLANIYSRARYYDASSARFLSEDPIRWRGGMNLYRYVRNNPVRYSDPSGRSIHTRKVTMTSDYDIPYNTKPGGPYCEYAACTYAEAEVVETTLCRGTCSPEGESWGFDATIDVHITTEWHNSKAQGPAYRASTSYSRGDTLGVHERRHVKDGSDAANNPLVQTEGFRSRAECEVARGNFANNIKDWIDGAMERSGHRWDPK